MDGHPWLALTIDWMMRPLYPARRLVVPEARGDVLELGVGTGLNFGLYGDGVRSLAGIDPDPFMLARARARAAELRRPIELHQAGAEALPFDRGRFDTVVMTFTLCTIPDVVASLAEARRVLKPGGRMLFVEHTRSIQPGLARAQDALTPLWKKIGGGCHLNRAARELIARAGFEITEQEPVWRERWTLLPVYRGVAVSPG
ncbi:MAG TPA: methyltransferase domain-containing protein [Candidatus Limnocylindria bacterium]|nr:methyltransferase domain-containing protein [Candidatus Limnocylindria bacterium]